MREPNGEPENDCREPPLSLGCLSHYSSPQVVNLRELLGKCNLIQCQSADIEGGSAPPAALQKMAALVEAVNTVHSKVLRMEGNHASKFVSPSVERSASLLHDSISQLDMIVVLKFQVLH